MDRTFEQTLRERAQQLAPVAMDFLEKIAAGKPLGSQFYRIRSTTALSAVKLILNLALENKPNSMDMEDYLRLERLNDRAKSFSEEEQKHRDICMRVSPKLLKALDKRGISILDIDDIRPETAKEIELEIGNNGSR